jgi:4-alpha-glucanotransferase
VEEVNFYCWEQFQLDAQLHEVLAYAHKRGVAIKGDLPIGVSRQSVDAWQHGDLFHLDSQAGAPPDAFAVDGQNWGFPTYNWEKMAEDGFAWWKARMRKMAEYFDAFRIDHILGFFRIWEIPVPYKSGLMGHFNPALPYSGEELRNRGFNPENTGDTDCLFVEDPRRKDWWHPRISSQNTRAYAQLPDWLKERYNELYNDFFYHRHNAFWKESAYRKLPALLRTTGMLCCGEDLGMIPASVPETMADLDILSLEIQRMPKDPKDTFADPARYPYSCVCATGTHDTSPLRAWWEEDRALTQQYFNEVLHCGGEAPAYCEPWVADLILGAHLKSPAMLVILPLQDWMATDGKVRYAGNPADERINVPAIPRYYWRYRMHCTLESLIGATDFNAHVKGMIDAAGRNK